MECKPRRASIRPGGVLIYTFDRVGAHGTQRFVEQRQRIHMGVGFAPGGELVEVVPFGDQEPLGRGAFDALDVGAAHEVDAAGGSDRLVSLRAPLLVVDILSCSDGPQDGLSVSETRQHAQQRFRAQGRLNPYDYDFMPKEAAPVAPRSAPDSPSVWVGFTRSVRRKGRKSQNAPREVTGAGPCHLSDCTTR